MEQTTRQEMENFVKIKCSAKIYYYNNALFQPRVNYLKYFFFDTKLSLYPKYGIKTSFEILI